MKKILTTAIVLSITAVLAIAQIGNEEKEVVSALEELRLAMIDGNRAALEKLAADDLSYGHSSGAVDSKADFVEKIASGKSNFVKIQFSNQTIKIVNNTAIIRHTLNASTEDAGKQPGEVNLQVLYVWQKQNGTWKMLARQAVKVAQ